MDDNWPIWQSFLKCKMENLWIHWWNFENVEEKHFVEHTMDFNLKKNFTWLVDLAVLTTIFNSFFVFSQLECIFEVKIPAIKEKVINYENFRGHRNKLDSKYLNFLQNFCNLVFGSKSI